MIEVLARSDSSIVGTARLRARGSDRLVRGGRSRLDRWTSRMELRAPGLPPSAILIVRSLRGRLRADDGIDEPPAIASMQSGIDAALAYYATHAVRVAQHVPGEACDAVYFENLSELLACLARDWTRGCAGARWWWRSLVRSTSPDRVLADVCARYVQYVPDLFERLARSGETGAMVERLPAADAGRIFELLAHAHGLEMAVPRRDLRSVLPDRRGTRDTALARLLAVVPELAAAPLDHAHARLLALSLALARAPQFASSAEFPVALRALEQGRAQRDREHPTEIHPGRERHLAEPARSTPDTQRIERGEVDTFDVPHALPLLPFTAERGEDTPPGMEDLPPRVQRDAPGISSLARIRTVTPPAVPLERSLAGEVFEALERSSDEDAAAGETRFGGLFYVLNALLHMNIYCDFTQPRRRAIDLSPWDFLAICGEEWFGARFANDALAPFLARLAGRERGAPVERPRWMRRLIPRIETRIAQALGERRVRRALVRLAVSRARAIDSGTHLDIHFELAKLPLAVRFAGLDRDPGWIPAAGRIVAFHFD